MSTEFVTATDAANDDWDETRFVRWGSRARGGCGFEFGTVSNWEECVRLAAAGETFQPLGADESDADFGTTGWFNRLVMEGRASFGEFPATIAFGSDTAMRFGLEL